MEQRSEEWFEARKGRITASVAGAILGHAPYMTRDQVMRAMVRDWHGAEREFTGNIATEYGTRHEDGALVEYEMESGNVVEKVGFETREDWAGCSPDGLISITGGVEIKCPFGKRKMGQDEKHKPLSEQPHYYDQVQFSLWVTQRAFWDFYQWAPGNTMCERVTPDSAWRSKNLPKLKEFWEDYKAERWSETKHLEPLRAEIDTPDAHRLMREYDELTDAIDQAEERMAEVKDQIIGMCADRNAVFAGRKVTKIEKAGRVAYAKVVKDHAPEVDLEPYCDKPSVSWKIT